MKKIAAIAVLSLGLTGCSTMAETAPDPASEAQSRANTGPTGEDAEPAVPVDARQAKAAAIAAGRPEAAWDKGCLTWELPQTGTKGQKWANELGAAWLESYGATCPDAIEFPQYYVDSFEPGKQGELVMIMDKQIMHDYAVTEQEDSQLRHIAMGLLDRVKDDHPGLQKVTARIVDHGKERSSDLADLAEWTAVQGAWYGILGDDS